MSDTSDSSRIARTLKMYRAIWTAAKQTPPDEFLQVLADTVAALGSIRATDVEERDRLFVDFLGRVRAAAREISMTEAPRRTRELLSGIKEDSPENEQSPPAIVSETYFDEDAKRQVTRRGGRKDCRHRIRQDTRCLECKAELIYH